MRSLWISQLWILGAVFYGAESTGEIGGNGRNGKQNMTDRKKVTTQGKYFIVAFLQNGFLDDRPRREILVTGTKPSTTVTVTMNKSTFKNTIQVGKGETVTFDLPKTTEVKGSGVCPCTTIIKSDADINVMARNFKKTSGDVSLIYPVDQWGTEYFIVTPSNGPSNHYTEFTAVAKGPSNHYPEFAVVTYEFETTVNIFLTGSVQFKGKNYKKGDTLTTKIEPFESLQIQSEDDLSGTKVTSQHPVAVLSGHSCAPSNEGCSHVFEQLQPVTSWGTSYFVPGMSFQSNCDQVFVLASKSASFEHQSGGNKMTKVEAGQLMKFNVSVSSPLSIHSTEKIQVLLFGTGGKYKGKPFGPFLTKIPDVNSFNLQYNLIGQDNFDNNLAIIIAKSSTGPKILYNGKVLDITKWNVFPESDYSWGEYYYGAGSSSNKMKHLTTPFGLLSIGYSKDMAYGTVAPSIQGPGGPLTPVPEMKDEE
ncbi:IgGFc-binding protein-like [Engystomops pustulosus]|uniref:IgGFc-binding protein-like n=1 Tax=Engystomops pustulosus TaxID=76066 RepID=UPI003AFB4248